MSSNNIMSTLLNKFTKQYLLSKTLRFELKPVGSTSHMLEEAKVFEKDELLHNKYEMTKPFFDRLHREFVKKALTDVVLSKAPSFYECYRAWKKDNAQTKPLDATKKELYKEIGVFFDEQAKKYKDEFPNINTKKADINLLFEESVFELLKAKYGMEEGTIIEDEDGNEVSIFDDWKGFTGYFIKFHETRKNFYKTDGTSTAIATRIVNNLQRFCDNLEIYASIIKKIDRETLETVESVFNVDLEEMFSIQAYNDFLMQEGIDLYNNIIGGITLENGDKLQGLNELVNKYRQDHNGDKLPYFKKLDKQILSEKVTLVDTIENDEQLLDVLNKFVDEADLKVNQINKLIHNLIDKTEEFDLAKIYISNAALNTISHRWTDQTHALQKSLYDVMAIDKPSGLKYEKADDSYKFSDFIALEYLKIALSSMNNSFTWKERYSEITQSETSHFSKLLNILRLEQEQLIDRQDPEGNNVGYNIYKNKIAELLSKDFEVNNDTKVIIKNFADSILSVYQLGKYFALEKKRAWVEELEVDSEFYEVAGGYREYYEDAYDVVIKNYNLIRNYLTKKPYSTDKWKLNFENPTLANGWDKNKESDNTTIILRKGENYYLGIMKKGHNKLFDDRNIRQFSPVENEQYYEKVVYKFFPDQAKMFPKVCFSKKGVDFFDPPQEILSIYKNAEFKKGDSFSLRSMHKLIDFYKDCLKKYDGWKEYNFKHLKPTVEYKDNIGEFFRDVAQDGYKITYQHISDKYIDEKNKSGELFLFQIKNKDWNTGSNGKKNLHTIYFESLFSSENATHNFVTKLNGQAELFFRPKTSVSKLGTKLDKRNKEVVDHKRYSQDKIFFHVPMTFNRTSPDNSYRFNSQINDYLANNPDVNIIGIDRGEKHLAYYTVINQKSEILERGSFNIINGVDYAKKLAEKAENREQARRDWQDIESIKDLKKGYISLAVREIANLVIKYNAIVVLEDLNMRFKQIRGGIEKSVYQQLEGALIDKLSFLVNKEESDPNKPGHVLNAYQLTAPFTSFKDMGKQTGIIFYTQAAYTSKIDPATGWRPNIYLRYTNADKAKTDLLKFESISCVNDSFEFTYDIRKFNNQKEYPKKTIWTVCSNVERYRWNKKLNENRGGYDHFKDVTESIEDLLNKYDFDKHFDILNQIKELDTKGNENFFKDLIFYFGLICQIRNTNSDEASGNDQNDFILSPVTPFYDSRKESDSLPANGDENGAYSIARKGALILEKISEYANVNGSCEKLGWKELFISNTDWDNFAQK